MSTTQNIFSVYPKFPMAVDCVVFGYEADELKLLLYRIRPANSIFERTG